jgi:large repetitive protein
MVNLRGLAVMTMMALGLVISSAPAGAATVTHAITAVSPASGPAGAHVTITGTGLTGASQVLFNGKAAAFTAVSDTEIDVAAVPVGASTGSISLDYARVGGSVATVTSSTPFAVNWALSRVVGPTADTSGDAHLFATGWSLGETDTVTLNDVPLRFSLRPDGSLDIVVPAGVPVSGWLTLRDGTQSRAVFLEAAAP